MKTLSIDQAQEILKGASYVKSKLDPNKISGEIIYWIDFLSPEKERLTQLVKTISPLSMEIKQIPLDLSQIYLLKIFLKEEHTLESLVARFHQIQNIATSCGIDGIDEIGAIII